MVQITIQNIFNKAKTTFQYVKLTTHTHKKKKTTYNPYAHDAWENMTTK